MITVTANLSQVREQIRKLGEQAPLAAARALNRSIASVQTSAVRSLADDLNIAQKFVRAAMRITKATRVTLKAELEVTGRRLPLIAFNARGPQPSRGKGPGVRYSLGRGRGLAAGAFIARVASAAQLEQGVGHLGVFRRLGPSTRRSAGAWSRNLPIVELFGPSLPRVFSRAAIAESRRQLAGELFAKNIQHEVEFLVRGLARTGEE